MTASAPRAVVARYLVKLRRRALMFAWLRRSAAALGLGALAFVACAWWVGPAVSATAAAAAWLFVGLAAATGAALASVGDVSLSGPMAARALGRVDGSLASSLRTAAELADLPAAAHHAPTLVDAHAASVARRLGHVAPARVVPWRSLGHPAVYGGLAAAVLALLAFALADTPAAGAYALTHPRARAGDAVLGAVVASLDAELVFPSHLDREPARVEEPVVLEAPRGTTVALHAVLRVDAREALVDAAGAILPLELADGRVATGRFVLRDDGPLRLRVRDARGRWLEDAIARRLRAIPDAAPSVLLRDPDEDRVVELDEPVAVAFEVSDDVGVVDVDLVVEGPRGESRRRLLHYPEDRGVERASSTTRLIPGELGAREGDALVIWIEARDGDRVMGPNVGTSERRVLTVASEATRRSESMGALAELLDLALYALADRLERPVPEAESAAAARFSAVAPSTQHLVDALTSLDDAEARAAAAEAVDATGLARLLRRERARHVPSPAPFPARRSADDALVESLESAALALADALSTARLGDVAALARELEALRREIASLLDELRRGGSESTKEALREALSRAEQRMREIAERLASMREQVPSDFLNADALERHQAEDTLAALRDAVEGDDLDEAERRLAELERTIDALASGLAQSEQSFGERSAGPRQRAMSELMDALTGLEDEQRGLAQSSGDTAREAGDRALDAAERQGGQDGLDALAERADALRQTLDGLDESRIPSFDREMLEGAKSRLGDARDALASGDLGEARDMMQSAARSAADLARDLDLGARMFPGQDGSDLEQAARASAVAENARELARDVERAVPNVDRFVTPEDRRAMRDDATRQRRTRGALDGVREQLGPNGALPDLGPIAEVDPDPGVGAMREAARALREANPLEASRAQEQALERLRSLRERIEGDASSGGGRGETGDGEGGEGGGWARSREAVEIPRGEDFEGPAELRRRLLDAMRERPPDGWRSAVDRYYGELLR